MQAAREGLTVMGEAARSAQPEIVELSFDVHSTAPTTALALRDNAMKVMQIGQAMMSAGVAQTDLQAGAAAVYPIYQPVMPGMPLLGPPGAAPFGPAADSPHIAGYHVVSFLKLSLSDTNRIGDIVDAATRSGANISSGFLFRLRDEAAIRRSLLEAAGRDAREKAETLASVLGKGLGDPISVYEDFSAYQLSPTFANGYRTGPFALAPTGTITRVPFTPGELTFQARVGITYRLQ